MEPPFKPSIVSAIKYTFCLHCNLWRNHFQSICIERENHFQTVEPYSGTLPYVITINTTIHYYSHIYYNGNERLHIFIVYLKWSRKGLRFGWLQYVLYNALFTMYHCNYLLEWWWGCQSIWQQVYTANTYWFSWWLNA